MIKDGERIQRALEGVFSQYLNKADLEPDEITLKLRVPLYRINSKRIKRGHKPS